MRKICTLRLVQLWILYFASLSHWMVYLAMGWLKRLSTIWNANLTIFKIFFFAHRTFDHWCLPRFSVCDGASIMEIVLTLTKNCILITTKLDKDSVTGAMNILLAKQDLDHRWPLLLAVFGVVLGNLRINHVANLCVIQTNMHLLAGTRWW